MAISAFVRHDRKYDAIARAVLVESADGKNSLLEASRDALAAIAPKVKLEHYVANEYQPKQQQHPNEESRESSVQFETYI